MEKTSHTYACFWPKQVSVTCKDLKVEGTISASEKSSEHALGKLMMRLTHYCSHSLREQAKQNIDPQTSTWHKLRKSGGQLTIDMFQAKAWARDGNRSQWHLKQWINSGISTCQAKRTQQTIGAIDALDTTDWHPTTAPIERTKLACHYETSHRPQETR